MTSRLVLGDSETRWNNVLRSDELKIQTELFGRHTKHHVWCRPSTDSRKTPQHEPGLSSKTTSPNTKPTLYRNGFKTTVLIPRGGLVRVQTSFQSRICVRTWNADRATCGALCSYTFGLGLFFLVWALYLQWREILILQHTIPPLYPPSCLEEPDWPARAPTSSHPTPSGFFQFISVQQY